MTIVDYDGFVLPLYEYGVQCVASFVVTSCGKCENHIVVVLDDIITIHFLFFVVV